MNEKYYIYCITRISTPIKDIEISGLDNTKIFITPFKDLCAVSSVTLKTSYDPTLENLQQHESIVSALSFLSPVLPMRFSTVCGDIKTMEKLLETYYSKFVENLNKVDGKVELGIKIFGEIECDEEETISSFRSGKEYLERKYVRYLEKKASLEPLLNKCDAIHEKLQQLSEDSSCNKPLKNRLLLNASYLVKKEIVSKFTSVVNIIKEENQNFVIIFSGPWPPYHFASLKGEKDIE